MFSVKVHFAVSPNAIPNPNPTPRKWETAKWEVTMFSVVRDQMTAIDIQRVRKFE